MRPVLATSLAFLLVVSALPAEAHPLPKTEQATREIVKDVLTDTDGSGAKLLRTAWRMVRDLQRAVPPTPGLPETKQGELEIRATLVQPGVLGQDMTLGMMWIGASEAYWTGVYWIESDGAGQKAPNVMDVSEQGLLLFVDGGSLSGTSSVDITYHFLGLNGVHVVHELGEIPLLAQTPVLDRVDVGGARATSGEENDIVFLTPWNIYDHNVTAGITIVGGSDVLVDETITACGDWQAEVIEPGCRLLYALPFGDAATAVRLWSLDEDGERRVEREISRADLLRGVTFEA